MQKKNPYTFTIGFNKHHPQHIKVANILNGRADKAEYLVRAVLSYEGELSETEQTLDAGIVKQLIRQVLAEEYETAERPVSPSHQAEQEQVLDVSDNHMSDAQSKDLRRSISKNLQSFRGRH